MRAQLLHSAEHRRRSSTVLAPCPDCKGHHSSSPALHEAAAMRRGSGASLGGNCPHQQQQQLAVPDLKHRRTSLSTSTSALLGLAQPSVANRKRGSFTSVGSGLLSVPWEAENQRRRSLPGTVGGGSDATSGLLSPHRRSLQEVSGSALLPPPLLQHASPASLDRRRSSVRPDDVYEQINADGTRRTQLFGLALVVLLAAVIGLSFLRLFR